MESGRRHQDVIKITSAATQKYYTCTYKRNTCHKKRKKPSVATSQPQLGFSSPVTRRSFFFFRLVVWLILYFADALLITDSRSSHCFLVNSQNCGKKGRKKGTRERTSGVLTCICVPEEEHATVFLFFFQREESAACRAAYHLSLCFCFSSDPPRGRSEDEGGVRLTHNRYHILLQLLSLSLCLLLFRQFPRKTERKKEKIEIKTKAKPKMTSKMDDF